MTYEEFNTYCESLPATTYVMQWGKSHVWKVAGKVFAIGGWDKNHGEAYTFKTSQLNFDILKDEAGYRPAPYLASRGFTWIQMYDCAKDSDDQLYDFLQESHRIVSLGLTKKKQKEFGLNQ